MSSEAAALTERHRRANAADVEAAFARERPVDFEQELLGCLLLDPNIWAEVAVVVAVEDFSRHDHRLIFSTIGALNAAAQPADSKMVIARLYEQRLLEAAGGSAYISILFETATSVASFRAYAAKVRKNADARRQIVAASDVAAIASEKGVDAAAHHAREMLESLARRESDETPLFDLEDCRAHAWLVDPPPAREMFCDALGLDRGVAGTLGAAGSTGKSKLLMQLATCTALGIPFIGLPIDSPGGVLMLCAEDQEPELHRRMYRIGRALREAELYPRDADELVRRRLVIKSRVGENNLLTEVAVGGGGRIVRTRLGDRICKVAERIPDLRLIVLDPASRFRGGVENSNDDATRFVEAVESIRSRLGCVVIVPHHFQKDRERDPEHLSIEDLRGAGGLGDGFRWVAAMATMRADKAGDYNVKPINAGKYVRLAVVKANYAPQPWFSVWLERTYDGVFVPAAIALKQRVTDDDRYADVLPRLQGVIRQRVENGEPLTRTKLRDFAGTDGVFGVGDHALRAIVERAILEKKVRVVPTDGKETLAC